MVIARGRGLGLFVALVLGCGGGSAPGKPSDTSGASGEADDESAGVQPRCTEVTEPAHPSFTSEGLTLELLDRQPSRAVVIPPFEFEVQVQEDLVGPVQMELIIYDPNGETTVQRFGHENMREVCDPYCLPVRDRSDCPPRTCRMQRFRAPRQRIEPAIYRASTPGPWTYVLHRLDNDDRVSVTRRLFEGESLDGEACEAIPVRLGDFRRVDCRQGVVPMGTRTNYWGLKARYLNGNCRANVFALPLSDGVRVVFDEGPYNAAPEQTFPDGTVHEVRLGEVSGRAWLAHHHFYLLAGRDDLPGYDELTGAFLRVFPVVGGPVREIPSCDATGDVIERTVAPVTLAEITGGRARFHTHFEGNRPAGVRATFHDRHPLALTGLRRREIVHAVDGVRVNDRRELSFILERMTAPGHMDIVVARERVRHARCIRLTIEEPQARAEPPPPPPPPPERPGHGRHCERSSNQCWDCVDFAFPAEVGCRNRCRQDELCVRLGGENRCLESTRVCCADGQTCNTPPGCDGPATSCSSAETAGRNERCTFLGACPQPLPGR